jgi:hypothetical protein
MWNSRVLGLSIGVLSTAAAVCLIPAPALSAQSTPRATLMTRQPDFDSRSLVSSGSSVSGFSLTNPNRFSMRQSYSVSAMSSSAGSASSGLYLNTVGYKISDPLFMFVDVGIHTPLHSSIQGMNGNAGAAGSSMVIPRMGLEYRPTERLTVNLELVNGPDAWKAYGPGWGFGRSSFYGSRFP